MEDLVGDKGYKRIGTERQLQKSWKDILEKSQTHIPQSTSYLRSTVRKMPDEYQRWGIVDEETVVQKYDLEEEIYALDQWTKENKN